MRSGRLAIACVTLIPVLLLPACAPQAMPEADNSQQGASLADYQRAEQFLSQNTDPLVLDEILGMYWQGDEQLVYRKSNAQGSELVIADVLTGSKTGLVDPILLANALTAISDSEADPADLDISDIELNDSLDVMRFDYEGERYEADLSNMEVREIEQLSNTEALSPDGSKVAYIEDYNLWVRDLASGRRQQLTSDGSEHYGYATNNAGWIRDDEPVLLWSPDSSKIATFRHDGREVGEMYLYTTQVGHPELDAWKYPLPGDEHIFMIERLVIHVEPEPLLVWLDMPADAHRSTTADHVADFDGTFLDVQWSEDSETLAFISSTRDHKSATLRVADANTGAVRDVYNETVATYYESGVGDPSWRYLPQRNEFIWYSERDNWGHLYLFDLETGVLKQQLTSGDWLVLRIVNIDVENEQIYFLGSNREAGDPYFHYLYRVGFDGSDLTNLTPENGHHRISWSESGEYFVDRASTPTEPEVAVIRDLQGNVVLALEEMDITALEESGWVAPRPFTVKARDGMTDLYGLLYLPSNLDESRSYPVLNYLYPGPQTGSVGGRNFLPSRRDKQALAELGFIVVEVDAMGTPGRSKAFHDAYYGNMGDNGLPDQITAIRQLAQRYDFMDLDRVGIWGHSGGGFASTAGILRYPDFYKVAVSGAGNHDNRNYEDDWAEKWQGLLEVYDETGADGQPTTNYDNQANQLLAENLEGKLLLAHGMLDDNVHPSNTLLVVQALIEAEKDFDLLLLPDARHGFGNRRYFMERRWDYFVRHLQGTEPPDEFRFAGNIP